MTDKNTTLAAAKDVDKQGNAPGTDIRVEVEAQATESNSGDHEAEDEGDEESDDEPDEVSGVEEQVVEMANDNDNGGQQRVPLPEVNMTTKAKQPFGRGRYNSKWTDEQCLDLLRVYERADLRTHEERRVAFNAMRSDDLQRDMRGTSEKWKRLKSAGVTIASLQAKISGEGIAEQARPSS